MKVLILQEELEEWFKKYGGTTYITMKEKKDKNWWVNYINIRKLCGTISCYFDEHFSSNHVG